MSANSLVSIIPYGNPPRLVEKVLTIKNFNYNIFLIYRESQISNKKNDNNNIIDPEIIEKINQIISQLCKRKLEASESFLIDETLS